MNAHPATWGAAVEQFWPKDYSVMPGIPTERIAVALDVLPWLARKWDALCAHRSEAERGAGAARFAALPDSVREQWLGTEYYRHAELAPGMPRTSLWA